MRHVDTAQVYKDEAEVSAAIKNSGLPRANFFITSKMGSFSPGAFTFNGTILSLRGTLDRMQFEYLDLFLIHSPADTINRLDQWRALLYARDELGLVRSIGVSNYQTRHLEEIWRAGLELPAVNQLQIHLWLTRDEDLAYAQSNGIVLEAWALLGHVPWWEQEPSLLRVATAQSV